MRKKTSNVYEDHAEFMWAKAWLLRLSKSGEDSRLPLEFRIYLVGLKRYRANGHASFSSGELRCHLPKSTGEMYTDRHINGRIRVLVDAELLAPASNTRCLVYPRELLDMQAFRGQYLVCPEHKTSDHYSLRFSGWMESRMEPPAALIGFGKSQWTGTHSASVKNE